MSGLRTTALLLEATRPVPFPPRDMSALEAALDATTERNLAKLDAAATEHEARMAAIIEDIRRMFE